MKGKNVAIMIFIYALVFVLIFSLVYYVILSRYPGSEEGSLPLIQNLAVGIDSEDNLHIVWEDERDDDSTGLNVYYAKFDSEGRRLIKDKRLTPNGGRSPSIEIDSQDNIWVTYRMNETHVLRLTSEGEEVFKRTLSDITDYAVATTVGSDDNIYLSWDEWRRGQCFEYYMSLDNDGNVLRGITNVSLVTPVPGFPIVIDDSGRYVYLGDEGSTDSGNNIHEVLVCPGNDILYTRINSAGEVVANKTQLTDDGYWGCFPRVVIDSSDNIHIIDTIGYDIGYIELDNTGEVQRSLYGIRGDQGTNQHDPELDVDSSGNVFVTWNVWILIREYTHSGFRDYSFAAYCGRIGSVSNNLDYYWIVAESPKPESDNSWLLMIALFSVVLAVIIVLVLLLRRSRRQEEESKRKNADKKRL